MPFKSLLPLEFLDTLTLLEVPRLEDLVNLVMNFEVTEEELQLLILSLQFVLQLFP